MRKDLDRRSFLKLSGLTLASLAFDQFQPNRDEPPAKLLARVAISAISIYKEPTTESQIVGQRFRDELIPIYFEVTPPTGPAHNPQWYRVWGGYAHSAHLQRVKTVFNQPLQQLRENGDLLEVSVPFITSLSYSKTFGWASSTRIYYKSTHWATGIVEGPDRKPWYKLTSELWDTDYYVPQTLLRQIPDHELLPLSPDIDPMDKRIEVRLDEQLLTAYEMNEIVFQTKISSGLRNLQPGPNGVPTETPKGRFFIQSKLPSKHMGQGRLTDDLADSTLLGVPWTAFFHETGVAFHGTYWHDNFGSPMSHGCINMRNEEAKWLFRWTTPINEPNSWEVRARLGTMVEVI